jgi:hypothetical protein
MKKIFMAFASELTRLPYNRLISLFIVKNCYVE